MTTDKIFLTKNYFGAFSDKNLDLLQHMFADDVALVDWEIQAYGIEQVLDANRKIFDDVVSIQVVPKKMAQHDNTVFAEIDVFVNNATMIHVVDVITFNSRDKITSITAFKR